MSTINEKLVRLEGYKNDIKQAIIDKGQTVGDNMAEFANAISQISGGGGDEPTFDDTVALTFVRVDGELEDCYVNISKSGTPPEKTFEYNKNGTGWQTYTEGDNIYLNKYEYVQFRSNDTNALASGLYNYRYFKTKGFYKTYGNVMSLVNDITSLSGKNYCFEYLFKSANIYTAPALPATTLAQNCYAYMFYSCAYLIKAPVLPATTLQSSCYAYMFSGCTSLKTMPELLAQSIASTCYDNMFNACTSLVNIIDVLPATTLKSYCYRGMFRGCSLITVAPELPAPTLISSCYENMFNACSKLSRIKVGATSWNTSYTNGWLASVAATGTFIKPESTEIPTNISGIPSGWTVENV